MKQFRGFGKSWPGELEAVILTSTVTTAVHLQAFANLSQLSAFGTTPTSLNQEF